MTTPSQLTCLIGQSHCGRVAGNPVCPKCGADEQVRYITQEAVMLAKAQASAKYWQNEAAEVTQRSAAAEAERRELERERAEEAKRQAQKAQQEAEQLREAKAAQQRAEEEQRRIAAEQAKRKPVQAFQSLFTPPSMVVLPVGSFLMGTSNSDSHVYRDERPQHKVIIAHKLAMGRYPLTFEEWDACVADGGVDHKPKDNGWGRGKRPVIDVRWNDAQAYIAWLNRKLGIEANAPTRYRLPSEAEWEYACRARSKGPWCFGDTEWQLKEYGWYSANSGDQTHPVGEKKANAFGLYDMHGNVCEWTQDCHHQDYNGAPDDGAAWEHDGDGCWRALRGGSWSNCARGARAAYRIGSSPVVRNGNNGFRLAKTVP